MAYDPNDSGEYLQTQKTYLDDLEIYDPELGCVVPAWKSLILRGALLKNRMIGRNDSAGAIAAEAQKGAPPSAPPKAPPLVADSAKDKASKMKLQSALDALAKAVGNAARPVRAACAMLKRPNARAARRLL